MAKVYDVNRIATYGGSTYMYYLKETLKSAGWAVSQSSDGSTLFSGSDGITTDAPGAGGMDNANAWYFIIDPAGKRGFTTQRGAGSDGEPDRYWRVRVANDWTADAITGSAIAEAPQPVDLERNKSASGTVLLVGSGSSDCEKFFDTRGTFRCHSTVYDVPHNGVYGHYSFVSRLGTVAGHSNSIFSVDPIQSGSTSELNLSPWIGTTRYVSGSTYDLHGLNTNNATNYNLAITNPSRNTNPTGFAAGTISTFANYGNANQYLVSCSAPIVHFLLNQGGSGLNGPTTITAHKSIYGSHGGDLLPCFYFATDTTAPQSDILYAYLGTSFGYRINTLGAYSYDGKKYPDVINLSTDARIMVSVKTCFPWPENITPIG